MFEPNSFASEHFWFIIDVIVLILLDFLTNVCHYIKEESHVCFITVHYFSLGFQKICPCRITHAPSAYCDSVNGVPSMGVLLIATVVSGNLNTQFVLIVSVEELD